MSLQNQINQTPLQRAKSVKKVIDIDNILFFNANKSEIYKRTGIYYNTTIISFDIETTSFYKSSQMDKENKQAIMYCWTLCINGDTILGRTWEEFIYCINKIGKFYHTDLNHRVIIWVHNLAFEFQFMRKYFEWDNVFSLKSREPVKAVTDFGIEFRCSYILSGYSLENLGKNLTKYKVTKLTGDLDYDRIRHSKTPLTDTEIAYCITDTLVVVAYISELVEREGSIVKLPLTKTGFVRNGCRDRCLNIKDKKQYHKYYNFIHRLNLTSEDYKMLKQAFAGGFTHANPLYIKTVVNNVDSFDIVSSYPYVMLSEKYPMNSFRDVKIQSEEELYKYIDYYACIMDITFNDIESIEDYDYYISKSHCRDLSNQMDCNGRIVKADRLTITINENDFEIIEKCYDWSSMTINKIKIAEKDYLPKQIMEYILELYQKKTELKDIDKYIVEYMVSKENINSMYGMCVTDIIKPEIIYNSEWSVENVDEEEVIQKNNKSKKRFLYYAWGVWVTSYARKNLWSAIYELKNDYIYSDTDSVKIKNYNKHRKYFEEYNENVINKLQKSLGSRNIDYKKTAPKNKNGVSKQIGLWEKEKGYKKFKTLGAKRYLVQYIDGDYALTVAGLGKKSGLEYILNYSKKLRKSPFSLFDDNMYVPKEFTGKLTHTYIDDEIEGEVTDYLGNINHYKELSCIHLQKADYSLSMTDILIKYILNIQTKIK